MATTLPPATNASTPAQELEALVALVARLSAASLEATHLAAQIQATLPTTIASQIAAAAPAPVARAPPAFVRTVAQTPVALETAFPEGSGEVWYVVIIGREPGMYRTAAEADDLTNGVPNQFRQKKTSRREALAFYRNHYYATVGSGVQKWVEAFPPALAASTSS
ncbi:hypothetical protein B0H10DRAFT_2223810 [Mycena sp. CBHHK59/15]|nr:hypothetical protein B0H10DRAFT_2223810 [Mycena sp. CBHHK59/15]